MRNDPNRSHRLLAAVAAFAVAGATFFGGCSTPPASTSSDSGSVQLAAMDSPATGDGAQSSEDLYTIDDDLRVRINRSELDTLTLVDGPIYVTGHTVPDADTVCSAIAYADLLSKLGYDARPVVLGDINKETTFILNEAGVSVPEKLEDASGANMVLVDHSEYEHSVNGLKDANIISVIDHHGDGAVTTSNPIVYDARPIGATATIIWMRYVNYGIKPDATISKLLVGAILSDTSNLKSKSTTTADREALRILAEMAGVDDINAFYANLYKATISYDGMTDEQIFNNDLKTYDNEGRRYAIGVVSVYDEEGARSMAERMKAILPAQHQALGVDYAFAQIAIFHDDISMTYLVPSDDASAEILKAAYGDRATFDGTSYVLNPGISRKTNFVPDINAVLASRPQE